MEAFASFTVGSQLVLQFLSGQSSQPEKMVFVHSIILVWKQFVFPVVFLNSVIVLVLFWICLFGSTFGIRDMTEFIAKSKMSALLILVSPCPHRGVWSRWQFHTLLFMVRVNQVFWFVPKRRH